MADRPEIRQLYKPQPLRRSWRAFEHGLLNLVRKLSEEERLQVLAYAERLALARIRARLANDRARTQTRRDLKRIADTAAVGVSGGSHG